MKLQHLRVSLLFLQLISSVVTFYALALLKKGIRVIDMKHTSCGHGSPRILPIVHRKSCAFACFINSPARHCLARKYTDSVTPFRQTFKPFQSIRARGCRGEPIKF